MYAIIRSGGKQSKVREGDVIDVERLKGVDVDGEVTFTPLLLVNEDGTVVADADALGKATVTAKVLGEHRGQKVDVFKYKNKSGYRRSQGHRQTYTTLEVTGINGPKAKKTAKKADSKKSESKSDSKKADDKKAAAAAAADDAAADSSEEG